MPRTPACAAHIPAHPMHLHALHVQLLQCKIRANRPTAPCPTPLHAPRTSLPTPCTCMHCTSTLCQGKNVETAQERHATHPDMRRAHTCKFSEGTACAAQLPVGMNMR
eukprot:365624-Chlamydomonas_euryale.AAC.3